MDYDAFPGAVDWAVGYQLRLTTVFNEVEPAPDTAHMQAGTNYASITAPS